MPATASLALRSQKPIPRSAWRSAVATGISRYALTFELDATGTACCTLRAQSWAEFPGLSGRAYRALVIGTRGHRLVVGLMLRRVARRA